MKWLASERVHLLSLDQIDPHDTRYALVPDWALTSRPLLPATEGGILVPLVGQQGMNSVRIVSGFRRFYTACEWRLPVLPVLLAKSDFPAPQLFKLPMIENRSQRNLTLLEQSTIVGKLGELWDLGPEQILEEFFPLLGVPCELHHYKRLMRLARLPDSLRSGLERIETDLLLGMASWPEESRVFLLERMFRLKLGRNKQRHLWQLCSELRDLKKEELSVTWEKAGVSELEQNEDLSPSDTFHQTLDRLRRYRYPVLVELEDRKTRLGRELDLPRPLQMSFPQFFEGNQIEFRLRAKTPQEVLELARILASRAESKEMEALFELL